MKEKNKIISVVSKTTAKDKGFSLIEIVLAIALVGMALLALVQLFTYSVMNNVRSERMTSALFLAQQQIDFIRNLPVSDLINMSLNPIDETIDINNDGVVDYRRVIRVQRSGISHEVRVLIFPGPQQGASANELLGNPTHYQVRADLSTVISR